MNIGKLALLGAVLAASSSFAMADTVAASYGSTSGYDPGIVVTSGNSALTYAGYVNYGSAALIPATPPSLASFTSTGTTAFDLNPNGVWANAIAGSSWVGIAANAGPVGTSDPQYGYYEFTTTLNTSVVDGTLNLMADDTVEVLLNGTPIVPLGGIGNDGHCADNPPSCSTADSVAFSAASGSELTFIVEQAGQVGNGADPSGVDFTITTTPEPSSLMLLGTGLVGAAGMLYRRRQIV